MFDEQGNSQFITKLNNHKSLICTLFQYKAGINNPGKKFYCQPIHTFTLEKTGESYILHQSWNDGIINNKCGYYYNQLTYDIENIDDFIENIYKILLVDDHDTRVEVIKKIFFKNIKKQNIDNNIFEFLRDKNFMLLYMYLT